MILKRYNDKRELILKKTTFTLWTFHPCVAFFYTFESHIEIYIYINVYIYIYIHQNFYLQQKRQRSNDNVKFTLSLDWVTKVSGHSHYTRSFALMNAVYQFIRKRVFSSRQQIRGDTTPGNRIIHAAATRETSSWR